jgi:hypothetical protein
MLKLNNIEAKRTGSTVILYLKSRKKANFRFLKKTNGKKRKSSIMNYRNFAISNNKKETSWLFFCDKLSISETNSNVTIENYLLVFKYNLYLFPI